jgi:hypothetical protein
MLPAAFGVDVAPGPVPGVRGDPGFVVEFGVETVCPGVVAPGGACVVLVAGVCVVDGAFGVRGVAVPVPAPAGTHGMVVGDCGVAGGGWIVPGTVVGLGGVGATVP